MNCEMVSNKNINSILNIKLIKIYLKTTKLSRYLTI